uniref:Cytochrome b n=1 Tax=Trichuris discolor TaxID=483153 RepID=J3SGP3_9BILA|nr:cytochrome b [Trichuris discolor]AFK81040.1 cytochrome b [Trichuris discolor]
MKKSFLTSIPGSSLVLNLPSPWNISYLWNLGSFLGMMFSIQLMTGILLVFYYIPSEAEAFDSVIFMMREVKFGFLLRFLHMNGASFLFILMYSHMVKGLMNASFSLVSSWVSGNLIFFLTILVAFMGYVLPWGNMGFWAATVITSFLSAIPYFGDLILKWIWGGYSISGRTLQFFFTFHYLVPFVIASVAVVHIMLLHTSGSSNPLGSHTPFLKIKFYPFFTAKDMLNFAILMLIAYTVLILPYWSSDPENFSYADRMSSPLNIQPEWYFLPFYALLRSSNSKLGGLVLMLMGIFMFWLLPSLASQDLKNFSVYYGNLWLLLFSTFLLGWIASWSADAFFSLWLKWFSMLYFSWWIIIWLMSFTVLVVYS